MYTPAAFVEDRPEVVEAFLAQHPMAQLVTMTDDGLVATPLPMLYEPATDGMGSLVGHVARANRQWATTSPMVEALAIFTGSNAYVSPNWYPSKALHGKVVPTWNYTTVHVRATLQIHDDDEWKLALVTFLTDTFEKTQPKPWRVADAPSDYTAALMQRIVGIELTDLTIEGKRKLSQNQSAPDLDGVRSALATGDARQQAVAQEMRMPNS